MKAQEVRDMADDALFEKAAQLRESLFRLRFKLALGNQDTVRQLRVERKDLARVKNELRARELEREAATPTMPAYKGIARAERKVRTARRHRGSRQ